MRRFAKVDAWKRNLDLANGRQGVIANSGWRTAIGAACDPGFFSVGRSGHSRLEIPGDEDDEEETGGGQRLPACSVAESVVVTGDRSCGAE